MKEKPILFTPENIRKIPSGEKTQTRRVVKPQPRYIPLLEQGVSSYDVWPKADSCLTWDDIIANTEYYVGCGLCPYGKPGDRLWVRETWAYDGDDFEAVRATYESVMGGISLGPYYRADRVHENSGLTWRSPMFMPRWAARTWLEITAVRVEQVQDITEEDAIAEGCKTEPNTISGILRTPRESYERLWDTINGKKYPWEDNPWVWVIDFTLI